MALELITLTASRSGEVCGMRWSEIDFDDATWILPAGRMKAGREHAVPLSSSAVAFIQKLAAVPHRASDYVFADAAKGTPIKNQGIWLRTAKLTEGAATTHGFRSSFRSWCSDHAVDREVTERALARVVANRVEAAYARSDLLERRRSVMEAWSRFLSGDDTAKVAKLRARGAAEDPHRHRRRSLRGDGRHDAVRQRALRARAHRSWGYFIWLDWRRVGKLKAARTRQGRAWTQN